MILYFWCVYDRYNSGITGCAFVPTPLGVVIPVSIISSDDKKDYILTRELFGVEPPRDDKFHQGQADGKGSYIRFGI